jgi:hypothetical protein
MASVATNENNNGHVDRVVELKKQADGTQLVNPFYSPTADSAADDTYKYAAFKVSEIVSGLKITTNMYCSHTSPSSVGNHSRRLRSPTEVNLLIQGRKPCLVPRRRFNTLHQPSELKSQESI